MNLLTRKHLSRRALLRGAGAVVALPLLESMLPAGVARAEAAAPPGARLLCIYVPHGAVMNRWTPSATGTGFAFSPTLAALEPFRDRVNVISGLSLPLASGQDASAGANHSRSSAVYLTGAEAREGSEAHVGVSIDQVAAAKIGLDSLLPSLELCIEDGAQDCGVGLSCAYRNTISWQTATSPLPMENNPQVVFERLFGDGATEQQRTARREQARSLLDSVLGEIDSLQRTLPANDRERMDHYLTDIREVERRIGLAAKQGAASVRLSDAPAGIPEDFEAHIKLLFDLQVLAWQANVTRVTTLMFAKETSNAVYAASGVREPFHNLSHHSNVPENLDRLAQLNAYHVKTFAYLLQKLQGTPEGAGNLLDSALILYGSGMSNSNQHDHGPLPIVLAGGAAGQLKGGRHIQVAAGTPLSNLQLAMLQKLGLQQQAFGDSTGVVEL